MAGVCEKVASDLGLGGAFHQVLRFPLPLRTGQSQISRKMPEKSDDNQHF